MTNDEKDDLDALVASPGWARLKAYAHAEYGPLLMPRVAEETDDAAALLKLRQARAVSGAITVLLEYPHRRLRELQPVEPTRQPLSRGGVQ